MTTKNPRLNVTLDENNLGLLATLAKKQGKSVSAVARDFILRGMDEDEDLYFSKLMKERDTPDTKWIPYDEVDWG